MPIADLEIQTGQIKNPEDLNKLRSLLEKINAIVHQALGVPDPEDQELRIQETEKRSTLKIAFTVGRNEYPDLNSSAFFVTAEQVSNLFKEIETLLRENNFLAQLIIESWANSTFIFEELEELTDEQNSIRSNLENLKALEKDIKKIDLKIYCDKSLEQLAPTLKEKIEQQLCTLFQLQDKKLNSQLVFPDAVDTDLAIEIDLKTEKGDELHAKMRELIAELLMQTIRNSNLDAGTTTEIWLRQNQAQSIISN